MMPYVTRKSEQSTINSVKPTQNAPWGLLRLREVHVTKTRHVMDCTSLPRLTVRIVAMQGLIVFATAEHRPIGIRLLSLAHEAFRFVNSPPNVFFKLEEFLGKFGGGLVQQSFQFESSVSVRRKLRRRKPFCTVIVFEQL